MQHVYLCHMKDKQGGCIVGGVFDSFELAKESWQFSYYKTSKKIVIEPTDDLGIHAYKVFVDGEHVGYIATHVVYTEVTHL